MHNFKINVLILCLLHVSNPRVHLQEDCCIYSNGMVCFTCIVINSVVSRRLLILMHLTHTIPVYTAAFLKMNPRVRSTYKT